MCAITPEERQVAFDIGIGACFIGGFVQLSRASFTDMRVIAHPQRFEFELSAGKRSE